MGRKQQMRRADTQITPEMKVWHIVGMIPKGSVCSYGVIASLAECPGCARWVGRILSQLPPDTSLPWHRVLRANGQIAIRGGAKLQIKRLQSEGIVIQDHRVDMQKYGWPRS